MLKFRSFLLPIAFGIFPAASAFGAVSVTLTLTGTDGVTTSTNVAPGSTFKVMLSLVGSGLTPPTTGTSGLDYYLKDAQYVSGTEHMDIQARDNTGNTAGTTYAANQPDGTVLAASAAKLNPTSDIDLGGSLTQPATPNGNGTFLVAVYTMFVPLGTSLTVPGSPYHLQVAANDASDAGTDGPLAWNGPPSFSNQAFSATTPDFLVNVVPEPASFGLLAIGALGLLSRRRRTA